MSEVPETTLWEEGRLPGSLVALAAVTTTAAVTLLDIALTGELSLFFDLSLVAICVAAALAVRPRDFFVVGVLPPLLMLGLVVVLGAVATDAVAEPQDGMVQATVSGLAHHAGALVAGYALTLAILAVRHTVLSKNSRPVRTSSPDEQVPAR